MRTLLLSCAHGALLSGLLFGACAQAQDFDRVAPKEPRHSAPVPLMLPIIGGTAAPASTAPVLRSLNALRFVDSPAAIIKSGVKDEGIVVLGDSLALLKDSSFRARLADRFFYKPLSMADLNAIAAMIRERYRQQGLPLVDVSFPEQDISTGTVQAVIIVYRLGQVHISGNGRFSKNLLLSEMQLKSGDPINIDLLRADLNRLARNPFHPVDVVLAKSDMPGATDLDLNVHARFPLRAYVSYDNYGEAVAGRDEYSAGFNVGNLLGLDEQLSYQFMTSPDLWGNRTRSAGLSDKPRFTAHSLAFNTPLPWGDFVNLFASYAELVPDLGPDFGQVGHNVQIGLRYSHDFKPIGALSQQIEFGFDFKRSDNNLAYGGAQVSAHTTNVEQFSLTFGASLPDTLGQTALENTLVYSPGGFSEGNTTKAFQAYGTAGARADYIYDRIDLSRINALVYGFTAYAHVQGQIASTELLPSEQLGAGGPDSVRGYDPRQVNGSNGALGSIELRSPSFAVLANAYARAQDALQLLVFYDAGWVAYQHAQQNQPDQATLESTGFGARYSLNRYVDVRFDYGWQLKAAPGAKSRGDLATISVTLGY